MIICRSDSSDDEFYDALHEHEHEYYRDSDPNEGAAPVVVADDSRANRLSQLVRGVGAGSEQTIVLSRRRSLACYKPFGAVSVWSFLKESVGTNSTPCCAVL